MNPFCPTRRSHAYDPVRVFCCTLFLMLSLLASAKRMSAADQARSNEAIAWSFHHWYPAFRKLSRLQGADIFANAPAVHLLKALARCAGWTPTSFAYCFRLKERLQGLCY